MAVELLDCMGDDLRVVNAAKTSLRQQVDHLDAHERGLLRYMLENKHATPFEHVVFTFRVRTSKKVFWEWVRHRTDSFSVESSRYRVMATSFAVPYPRRQIGKPGRYEFVDMTGSECEQVVNLFSRFSQAVSEFYNEAIELGLANEAASFMLPDSLIIEFWWTVKLRHALHFLSLRNAPTALREIRDEACQVEDLIRQRCPAVLDAWIAAGRPQLDSDSDADHILIYPPYRIPA